jgi:2'-5' RNA ligase
MASNLVIAALPADDDDVWQVSSEKKPHMTILFLGDAMTNPNVTKIADYVKDRSRELEPFSLLVDHRGFLGPDEADVLFFTKDIPWQLYDFRDSLKYNQEISMAYNAIPQHQDWKPHLTLGYPESPANSDDWDPMGTQYVTFDKIAVWFGDYEGPEYPLTENPKPKWREDSPAIAEWADKVGDALAHHGIKGMRWGVRRKNIGSPNEVTVSVDKGKLKAKGGEGHAPSEEAKAAAATKQKAKKSGVHSLSNKEIQDAVTRMNLESNFSQATSKTKSTIPGQKFVLNLLKNTGNAQVQRVVNDQATKAVKKHIGV